LIAYRNRWQKKAPFARGLIERKIGLSQAYQNSLLPFEIRAAIERAWCMFPVTARGKKPLISEWPAKASCELDVLEAWAIEYPGSNWGLATGKPSGVFVVDVDGEAGRASVAELERQGLVLPPTRTVTTGRDDGGLHHYFRMPESADIRNDEGKRIGPHIDVRGTGGFVVLPSSVHPTGRLYQCVDPSIPIADAPGWMIDRLTAPAPRPAAAQNGAQTGAQTFSKGGRTNFLVSLAGTMHKRGISPEAIEKALLEENAQKCDPPLPEEKVRAIAHDIPKRYPNDPAPFPDQMQAAVNDQRLKARLPGDNYLLSETAATLGQHFADELLFLRNGEIVTLEEDELRTVSAQTFRTLVERYIVCYRKRKAGDNTFSVGVTMTENEARGIMASPQFIEGLRRVRRLNASRLPVFGDDGKVELLPEGYHAATETLTVSTADYADNMLLDTAVATIDDLLSEFSFADDESSKGRSKAVAVASLVGLFSGQLAPEGSLRPCFITTKNAEGAGASTLVACAVAPVLGAVPIGTAPEDEAEMKKVLTTVVREGRRVLILDNVKGRLSSASLEAFISGSIHTDRLLGSNQSITGSNLATVFVTANGCTFSPDMRRRSLVTELHLSEEHPEDRKFRRPLDVPALLALRPKILGACWALVRNWEAQGLPLPDRSHSAFPDWAQIVGGIVQAAGYACPLNPAAAAVVADEDGGAMRTLVAVMTPGKLYTFSGIVGLCQANECFAGIVGNEGTVLDKSGCTTLGRILRRYDHRLVRNQRFIIEGKEHTRRFRVEIVGPQHDQHDPHDVPAEPIANNAYAYRGKHHVDHVDHVKSFKNDPSEPPEAHDGGKNGSLKSPAGEKEWL
jgi:Bifunctional DNA primase/polymerase, N-terminal/Primase C terminal 1 (PriCT-1)